ncbi:MAG: hypothetical protein IJZ33_07945 [Clostridia bacterium]|nr:hypothetical protein [Clostridia bacterium]
MNKRSAAVPLALRRQSVEKAFGALPQSPFRGLFVKSPLKTLKNFGRMGGLPPLFSFEKRFIKRFAAVPKALRRICFL